MAGQDYHLASVAQKRGVQILQCPPGADGRIPDHATRRKIEKQVTKSAYEHLIIFVDAAKTTQIWQWVARQPGQPAQYREHPYHPGHQSGDALIQKLSHIYIPLDEEEALDLTGATHRLRDAFDRDRVTKQFYDRFKTEHTAFLAFIKGITDQADKEWYASLMLNRLMFIYFIQKKGFLDGDAELSARPPAEGPAKQGQGQVPHLLPLLPAAPLPRGLWQAAARAQLDADLDALLGKVPYLNGGLFDVHELEERQPEASTSPTRPSSGCSTSSTNTTGTSTTRPLRNDNEINPDVLGYIFEKYINQKQMGAYYTKEDITDYIARTRSSRSCSTPPRRSAPVAFEPELAVWRLLRDDPDRYIYPAVRHGVLTPTAR